MAGGRPDDTGDAELAGDDRPVAGHPAHVDDPGTPVKDAGSAAVHRHPDDVCFLTLAELRTGCPVDVREIVAYRRRRHADYRAARASARR